MFTVDPIGYFHTSLLTPYDVPRQPTASAQNNGVIELKKGYQFEQALDGLEGFDRVWVIFLFHRHHHWKPKVLPPRGGKKQGVFATRSPHRPNFIGFSCVELQAIKGLKLFIHNHDLIDGTPILDLKPYLNYADAFYCNRQGWLDGLPPDPVITIQWSPFVHFQMDYLVENWNCDLQPALTHRLLQSPFPYANNRVKQLENGRYQLAYQTWRVYYTWEEGVIKVSHLATGYDKETLEGKKNSRWNDVFIHQDFVKHFSKE